MNRLIWQKTCPVSSPLQNWAQVDSLTQTLSQLASFSVELTYLGQTQPNPYFADLRLPEKMWGRNVNLCLNNQIVVQAQSLCSPNSVWCEILNCGTTPLGNILFSGHLNGLTRNKMQFTQPQNYLLARRSWFQWRTERLYLVECFLPEILYFIQS